MARAPYEVRVDLSPHESFEFTVPFGMQDGSAFPFADYAWSYTVTCEFGGVALALTDPAGIAFDFDAGWATFASPTTRLCCGRYAHKLHLTHTATGKTVLFFDGPVLVT